MSDTQKVISESEGESTVSSLFAWRKSERIASAMYLISSFMADETLLRDHLREASLKLVSETLSLRMSLQSADVSIKLLLATIYRMQSLIRIGNTCGLVSDMNAHILERELDELATFLASYPRSAGESDVSLTADFFVSSATSVRKALSEGLASGSLGESRATPQSVKKVSNSGEKHAFERQSVFQASKSPKPLLDKMGKMSKNKKLGKRREEEQSSRRRAILTLLAERPSVTINDVGTVVRGCSGKTLQREMSNMVRDGVLKRNGEKRWSTYSLAK